MKTETVPNISLTEIRSQSLISTNANYINGATMP